MVYNINKIFLGKYFKIKNMKTKKPKSRPAKGWLKLKTTEALSIVVTVLFLEAFVLGVNFYLSHASRTGSNELAALSGVKTAEAAPGTLDSYVIEKITDQDCNRDSSCAVPGEYMMQSRCQFTSKCLGNRCAVMCPGPKDLTWSQALEIINKGDERYLLLQAHQENNL
jgi:hypothetical protein